MRALLSSSPQPFPPSRCARVYWGCPRLAMSWQEWRGGDWHEDGGRKGRGKGKSSGKPAGKDWYRDPVDTALTQVQQAINRQRSLREMEAFFSGNRGQETAAPTSLLPPPFGPAPDVLSPPAMQATAPQTQPNSLQSLATGIITSAGPHLAALFTQAVLSGLQSPPAQATRTNLPEPQSFAGQVSMFERFKNMLAPKKAAPAGDLDDQGVRELLEEVRHLRRENEELRHGSSSSSTGRRSARSRSPRTPSTSSTRAPTSPDEATRDDLRSLLADLLQADSKTQQDIDKRAATLPEEAIKEDAEAIDLEGDEDPESVTPGVHEAFFQFIGAKSTLKAALSWSDWVCTAGRKYSLDDWKKRAKQVGLTGVPNKRDLIVAMIFHKYREQAAALPANPKGGTKSSGSRS